MQIHPVGGELFHADGRDESNSKKNTQQVQFTTVPLKTLTWQRCHGERLQL
jgi:hypothetical protein